MVYVIETQDAFSGPNGHHSLSLVSAINFSNIFWCAGIIEHPGMRSRRDVHERFRNFKEPG